MCLFVILGYLTTNTVHTRKYSVNTIDLNKMTRNSAIDKYDSSSMNKST